MKKNALKSVRKRLKAFSVCCMILVFTSFVIITVWGELGAKVVEEALSKAEKAPQAVEYIQ